MIVPLSELTAILVDLVDSAKSSFEPELAIVAPNDLVSQDVSPEHFKEFLPGVSVVAKGLKPKTGHGVTEASCNWIFSYHHSLSGDDPPSAIVESQAAHLASLFTEEALFVLVGSLGWDLLSVEVGEVAPDENLADIGLVVWQVPLAVKIARISM